MNGRRGTRERPSFSFVPNRLQNSGKTSNFAETNSPTIMETTRRQQASFRFKPELLNRLKHEAKQSNCSLNSYVESALMDMIYCIPNAETIEAINEVRSGRHLQNKPVDLTDIDSMTKSILD
jgi:hypothetical protein